MEGSSCCKQLFPPPFALISLSLSWSILKNFCNLHERLGLQYCNTSKNITFSPSGLIGSKHYDYLDQKKVHNPLCTSDMKINIISNFSRLVIFSLILCNFQLANQAQLHSHPIEKQSIFSNNSQNQQYI